MLKSRQMENDRLTFQTIQAALKTRWLGQQLYYLNTVPSTNDVMKNMAEAGSPSGTVILTDYQSRGKGRLNRRWDAPPGSSLLVSLLFRPFWPAARANWLTMIAGLAAVSAVKETTDLSPSLKWPNDLVLEFHNQWHKFGGLLLEGHFEDDRLEYAVLGSGINVNIPAEALPEAVTPPTSLSAVLGQPVSRLTLLNNYLLALEELYERIDSGWSPHTDWSQQLITLGRSVTVSGTPLETPLEGTATGVDEWGRLLVEEENGRIHTFAAGDVSLRG